MSSTSYPMPAWIKDDLKKARRKKFLSDVKNSKIVTGLKRQIEENPIVVLVAAAAIITASAKLIDAVGHAKGSRAYAKQVNYRINKNK